MEFKINIRHALTIGLALNRNCSEIINEIYYKNESLYRDTYLNLGMRDDNLKKIFTMKTEDMVNKLSGIIEVSSKKGDWILLEKIIRKAHPSIVSFVKKSNIVDLDKFNLTYNLCKFREDERFCIGISLIYLSKIYNKNIAGEGYFYFIVSIWNNYLNAMNFSSVPITLDSKSEKKLTEYLKRGYELFSLDSNEDVNCSLDRLISENIEKKVLNKLGVDYNSLSSDSFTKKNISLENYKEIRDNEFLHGINKYIGSFSRFLNSIGMDGSDIFIETNINNSILNNIIRDFYFGTIGNNLTESDFEVYIVSCLYIYNLVHLYKECKDIYLNKSTEEKYKEMKKIEEELNKEKELLKENEFKTKSIIKESKSEIEELKKKLKDLERENNRLSAKVLKDKETIDNLKSENQNYKDDIINLKEHLSNISDISLSESNITLDNMVDYINDFKIGIFGGMSNITKLSNKLNNITYYNSQNQDISSINNLDIIFINTDFINHAFTNKIKSVSSKLNIPMRYISGTNDEIIIKMIYKNLK